MADTPTESIENIQDLPIIEEMQESYLRYSMSVIMSRALPDVRDGLKPSQRRILVAANDLNLGPRSQHRKCAKTAGDTAGEYTPNGEQVTHPTRECRADPPGLARGDASRAPPGARVGARGHARCCGRPRAAAAATRGVRRVPGVAAGCV